MLTSLCCLTGFFWQKIIQAVKQVLPEQPVGYPAVFVIFSGEVIRVNR
jgi:hypothetical protein